MFPAAVAVTGISIFIASTNATSSPSPMLRAGFDWKRANASGNFGDDLDLWHPTLPGPHDADHSLVANGFLLWPQIA